MLEYIFIIIFNMICIEIFKSLITNLSKKDIYFLGLLIGGTLMFIDLVIDLYIN